MKTRSASRFNPKFLGLFSDLWASAILMLLIVPSLAKVLPLDLLAVRDGDLVFEDLAKKHGLGETGLLKVSWSRFDNETEQKTPLNGQSGFAIPREPGSDTSYYAADISREGDVRRTITVYVRNRHGQPEVVGIERSW